jgi:hypothetical protein
MNQTYGKDTHLQQFQYVVSHVKVGELGVEDLEVDVLWGRVLFSVWAAPVRSKY